MKQSLLGHLVFSIGNKTENLATEALCFILNRSLIANKAFILSISQKTGLELPQNLKFNTQKFSDLDESIPDLVGLDINLKFNTQKFSDLDESIPDLVGLDINGKEVVLGEAKFWAGLTDNQPVTYLTRLSKTSGSILVFIAPSKRFTTLWPELLRRCKELGTQQTIIEDDEFKAINIDNHPILALVSWRKVINSIQKAVGEDGDSETLSDIGQLQGLCDQIDETAFLPVHSDELASIVGKRMIQYCDLVDQTTEQLVAEGVANIKGLKATGRRNGYIRFMVIHNHGCGFQVNFDFWSTRRETPLWFGIKKIDTPQKWSFPKGAKEKLVKLGMEEPSRLFQIGNELIVPVFIPRGVEKADVITSLMKQIHEITDILATIHE